MLNSTAKNRSRIKSRKKWEIIVQINGQCYIRQTNGKLKEQNWCKTLKQGRRLFEMDIKSKVYILKNIWQ